MYGLSLSLVCLLSGAGPALGWGQPPSPINISPFLGEGNIALNPTLEIECPDQPFVAAQFQLSRNQVFDLILYDSGEIDYDLCSHLVPQTLAGLTTYYWRARVRLLSTQWTPWSNPTFFLTLDEAKRQVTVFQDGVFSFSGTTDADIRGSFVDPTMAIREWNQGGQDVLRCGRRPPGSPTDEVYRSLLQFDVSLLSNPSAVANVYLELTGWEHGNNPQVFSDRYSVFAVKRGWGEGSGIEGQFPGTAECSWTYAAFPIQWSSPGASEASDGSPSADRSESPLAIHGITNDLGNKTRLSSLALTELVQQWISDPASNHGILLKAEDESSQQVLNLASREHPFVHFRPRLVVEGLEAAARPANQPPVANRDVIYLTDETPVEVDPLANDFDPDNGPIAFQAASLVSHTQPDHGTLNVDNGLFTYTPDPGFTGKDSVAYTISDGEETATNRVVFYLAPSQFGNIDANTGTPTDVVFVNGEVGVGDERRLVVGQNDPLDIYVDFPPSRFGVTTNYALYLWVASSLSPVATPFDLGLTSLPTPLNAALSPQPGRRVNNLGYEPNLGTEKWPGPPTTGAPGTVLFIPDGVGMPVTFIIQGLMPDRRSISNRVGITNGVIVEVQ